MEKYLYCVIQEDELTEIHVTEKSYWEENKCQMDYHADDYISDAIESICDGEYEFSQENEAVYSPMCLEQIPTELIKKELSKYSNILEYSEEFEKFMSEWY